MSRTTYGFYGWLTDDTDKLRSCLRISASSYVIVFTYPYVSAGIRTPDKVCGSVTYLTYPADEFTYLTYELRILRMSYVFYVWITYILRMLTYISSAAKFWDFQNSRCGSAYVCGSCGLNYGWIRMLTDDTDPCGCLRISIRKHPQLP